MKSARFIFPVRPSTTYADSLYGFLFHFEPERIGPVKDRLDSASMTGSMNTVPMQELLGISGRDCANGVPVLVAKPDDKEKQ